MEIDAPPVPAPICHTQMIFKFLPSFSRRLMCIKLNLRVRISCLWCLGCVAGLCDTPNLCGGALQMRWEAPYGAAEPTMIWENIRLKSCRREVRTASCGLCHSKFECGLGVTKATNLSTNQSSTSMMIEWHANMVSAAWQTYPACKKSRSF